MADVNDTARALADAQATLDAAQAAHQAAMAAAGVPRNPLEVALDLFEWIIGRLGNHPDAEKLHRELKAAATTAAAPA
jgi:hypothetical protein